MLPRFPPLKGPKNYLKNNKIYQTQMLTLYLDLGHLIEAKELPKNYSFYPFECKVSRMVELCTPYNNLSVFCF